MLFAVRLIVIGFAFSVVGLGQGPAPRFTDPQRKAKMLAASEPIAAAFARYHEGRHTPGLIFGMVVDGDLVLTRSFGVANVATKSPVTPETRFRIASMTKSFTALAILKLRDEGKLSLEDPVAKWIPAIARWKAPTADSATLRVRHLLTHSAGFPEDNPWGDQQLGVSDAQLDAWLAKGLPFSTSPGTSYEYSNYGFALLGRIVQEASKQPYRQYMESEILKPLGMSESTLEPSTIPANLTATGYRRVEKDGTAEYQIEPSLSHGAFGAMGGLVTTARDMAKYVAFMLAAYPPRDDADPGPVRRSSVREMQELARHAQLAAFRPQPADAPRVMTGGYAYGLGVSYECGFGRQVRHGGGLPGFGSHMVWLPEHGVGIFTMANLTYSGASRPAQEAIDILRKAGALETRKLTAVPVLEETRAKIVSLWSRWDGAAIDSWAAGNLLMDRPAELRRKNIDALKAKAGACKSSSPVEAENWLRGEFRMDCEHGRVQATFTLAPTQPPTVQYLDFEWVPALTDSQRQMVESLVAGKLPEALAPKADKSKLEATLSNAKTRYGTCSLREAVSGNGLDSLSVGLDCERGAQRLNLKFAGDKLETMMSASGAPGSCDF